MATITTYNTEICSVEPSAFKFTLENIEDPQFETNDQNARNVLSRAASLLCSGEVVAIPTETVYGLAANALSSQGVGKIYSTKNRPADNPLIVHISSLKMLRSILQNGQDIPAIYLPLIKKFWPGPLTILLPKSNIIPNEVTCNQNTVAIRFPSHPIARALITECGFPLAAPSANISGRPSPTLGIHVLNDLDRKIPMIIDGGQCNSGVESTVLDAISNPKQPVILRPGGITFEDLVVMPGMSELKVYKKDFVDKNLERAPTTPGMKYKHYSPDAKVILIDAIKEEKKMQMVIEREINEIRKETGKKRIGLLKTTLKNLPTEIAYYAFMNYIEINKNDKIINFHLNCANYAEVNNHNILIDSAIIKDMDLIFYRLGDSIKHPEEIARELFKSMRYLDELKVDYIIVEGISEKKEGLAIMNSLPAIVDDMRTLSDIKLNIAEGAGKTDYYARKRLVVQAKNKYNSPKYRLVVRFTNKDIVVQIIYAKLQGDFVLAAANSHELPKYGIKVGLTNWAAAYATGLLAARRVLTNLKLADKYEGVVEPDGTIAPIQPLEDAPRPFKAYLDVGLKRTSTGSKVFAVTKGASDGGIFIPHSENRFPGYSAETKSLDSEVLRKYIYGGHVADYMRLLQEEDDDRYKRQFSQFIEKGVTADDLEDVYKNAHAKIRADPSFTPTNKTKDYKTAFAKYHKKRLNLKQRRNKVQQKIASFKRAQAAEEEE
ncbi:6245_t:CDS:2 [Ambispora leptoticha]|uniref:Threonylcarbamoyl-AMP synthase n=1 Tax=Ambispora leptoticha TaxID=144679 RepID=A0A9N8YSY4_9GLOM|nr:6245_t:CDS:2 [Ambispora leptoticha]